MADEFDIEKDATGNLWVCLPTKEDIQSFWDWLDAQMPNFVGTVFVDFTTGELPPRFFNEANEDRS
tara:strand:- start:1224 stop:1421 length:198 start_codon:yes stop_codon:yes gene_type:complete